MHGKTAGRKDRIGEHAAEHALSWAINALDRYAHGLTKARGLAGRHLDMEITARATRT